MTNLSNIVEILAKQALGGSQQNSQQAGLGGILGSVLGQLGGASGQGQTAQPGLGSILGSILGQSGASNIPQQQQSGFSGGKLLLAVLPLVLAWIQKQGGLEAALDKLRGQGLQSQVEDWVSTGPGANANVQQQQVQSLFDDAEVEQIAQDTQADKQDIYGAISQVLPEIIDSLTPQGENTSKQEANDDIQQVLNLVSGLFKR